MKFLSSFLLCCIFTTSQGFESKWTYTCEISTSIIGYRCVRNLVHDGSQPEMSLARCQLTCGPDSRLLWPRPQQSKLGQSVVAFNPEELELQFDPQVQDENIKNILTSLLERRKTVLLRTNCSSEIHRPSKIVIVVDLEDPQKNLIRKSTSENYNLTLNEGSVKINAENVFGARHGLETFFQMTAVDENTNECIVLSSAEVLDAPVFRHRGVHVDTARNFVDMETLKGIVDGMALNKLNVFHWHLTDSQSFPIALEKYPNTTALMAAYGAYGRNKVYTVQEVKDFVTWANTNGVRVIPEFDMPAHVGYGWQFPGSEGYTVCVGREPWEDFCVEPPCGQLNPFAQGMYNVLEEIFDEYQDIFHFDSFHMGGDEVHLNCWNSSQEVTQEMIKNGSALEVEDFIRVWSSFQSQALDRLVRHSPDDLETILWTSTLTDEAHIQNLPKESYTIQIWTDAEDKTIQTLASKGYKMIFSNVDSLYLDCGFSNWVGRGNNWCSPYKGWRRIYENDLYKIIENQGLEVTEEIRNLVLGAEVAIWSEQADSMLMQGLIFPRAAALAERLWTNPSDDYLQAETRMILHRERHVDNGIRAAAIQPAFCLQNQEACFTKPVGDEDVKILS